MYICTKCCFPCCMSWTFIILVDEALLNNSINKHLSSSIWKCEAQMTTVVQNGQILNTFIISAIQWRDRRRKRDCNRPLGLMLDRKRKMLAINKWMPVYVTVHLRTHTDLHLYFHLLIQLSSFLTIKASFGHGKFNQGTECV